MPDDHRFPPLPPMRKPLRSRPEAEPIDSGTLAARLAEIRTEIGRLSILRNEVDDLRAALAVSAAESEKQLSHMRVEIQTLMAVLPEQTRRLAERVAEETAEDVVTGQHAQLPAKGTPSDRVREIMRGELSERELKELRESASRVWKVAFAILSAVLSLCVGLLIWALTRH